MTRLHRDIAIDFEIGLSADLRLWLAPDRLPISKESISKTNSDDVLNPIILSFEISNSYGLLDLARHAELRNSSPSIAYWLGVSEEFLHRIACSADVETTTNFDIGTISPRWLTNTPPMTGAEYLDEPFLQSVWNELAATWQLRLSQSGLPQRTYLEQFYPRWADVGRVNFHLAENRKSESHPFVFLATYTTRVGDKARVQHRPIGLALNDSIKSSSPDFLTGLLRPIEKAAKHSAFLKDAVTSKRIYQPIYLSAEETHQVLSDFDSFESAGIVCKVPDFWKQRKPPRATLTITLGRKPGKSFVGVDSMVDFDATVAIGDKELSPEELLQLLNSSGPLIQLNGEWVEVNSKKLKSLIDQWDKASKLSGDDGISLGEALRLLAGFTALKSESGVSSFLHGEDAEYTASASDHREHWIQFKSGEHLTSMLDRLRATTNSSHGDLQKILAEKVLATLRPYQLVGVDWLHTLLSLGLGGCIADDMGLGKTLQIISLISLKKINGPTLLVLPASLIGNWTAELSKFAPSITWTVVHPSASTAASTDKPKNFTQDLYITTYSLLTRVAWLADVQWGCVIADEAQAIKNAGTRQSKAARQLKSHIKFALTGTPVENNLGDLWSIFDFCNPGLLGTQKQFATAVKGMEESKAGYGPLRKLIGPYLLRRRKTDKSVISDLPEKVEMITSCDLSLRQVKLYQQQVEFLTAAIKESEGIARKGLILSSLMKLKQICNHPSQHENDNQYNPLDSGKFEQLQSLAETIASRQEKVLIFTQFREITDVLQHFLGGIFLREGLVLHGNTPIASRKHLVDKFQSSNGPPFFVLSLKAGGTGLNLTNAQHVIHFDRWWNPAVENQATDRAFRIGQKKNVMVHKFVCRGTIEEKINLMIESKKFVSDAIIEGSAETKLSELSNEDLLSLVRLDINSI